MTLIAIWTTEQQDPWVVVRALPPARVGVRWYALRMWVELGFRAIKGVCWQWEHTRRRDPARIARYWLILAVATLWGFCSRGSGAAALPPHQNHERFSPIGSGEQLFVRYAQDAAARKL